MSTDNILLRPFTYEDASVILSWCKNKHDFRLWSADHYRTFPAIPDDMMSLYNIDNLFPMTMEVNGLIAGHILLRYSSKNKEIIRFGFAIVDDTMRGKGYGKQMMQLAIDYARNKFGVKKITLGVFCDNHSAIKCYTSVGFDIASNDSYIIDGEEWKGYEMELTLK